MNTLPTDTTKYFTAYPPAPPAPTPPTPKAPSSDLIFAPPGELEANSNAAPQMPPMMVDQGFIEFMKFMAEAEESFRIYRAKITPLESDFTACKNLGEFSNRLNKISQTFWTQFREVITIERIRTFLDANKIFYMNDGKVINNFSIQ